jgi:peptidoglycan/LPS O-acetylase OafA/YrhL
VVFYHAAAALGDVGLNDIFDRMYLFVDLFFLLSGFVLTLAAEPKLANGLSSYGFLKARIIRLWPLTALGAVLAALVLGLEGDYGSVAVLLAMSLLMIPMPSSSTGIFPLNSPQWSILWELIANYVHAALLWRLGNRTLLAFAGTCGVLLAIITFHEGWAGVGSSGSNWWMAAPRIGWSYILGMLMARAWTRRRPEPLVGWLTALFLPFVVLALVPGTGLSKPMGDALVVLVAMPMMFWLAITAVPPKWAESPLCALGQLSYPIYAVHLPTIYAFRFASGNNHWDPLAIVVTIALAALIAHLGPATRRGWKALFPRRPERPHATTA